MNKQENIGIAGQTMTAGGALLARLKAVGVDYIFANSGTDFIPIIEGLSEGEAKKMDLPTMLIMPHENAAMGMAYGYFLGSGKSQAVMVHTNVGLANCTIGAINAATEHVPVLLFSGRTPFTEKDRFGTRTIPIGWGQEMRDQAALVREASKWDYELRFPEQIYDILDRAYAVANSTPKGPVYMSLPCEVLCQPCRSDGLDKALSIQPAVIEPSRSDIIRAAEILAKAERPVVFAQRGAGSEAGFATLSRLAEEWAIPVVQYWALQLAVPTDHSMAVGGDPEPWISEADAILVIDALAPWSPNIHHPRADCPIIHMGPNPLYSRFPVRNFRSDLALTGETGPSIQALADAMEAHHNRAGAAITDRRALNAERATTIRSKTMATARAGKDGVMSKEWVSLCLSEAIAGKKASVLSELGCPLGPMTLHEHGTWYQEPHSGGLGWSFPAALGLQLSAPERLVVATMGDGSYVFANPVACHQIAEALKLPLLILLVNNAEWGAVRQSVLGTYPNGYAAKADAVPLTSLEPTPDFILVAKASRAWTATVEKGEDLPGVLQAAIEHIETKRTHALVEIKVRP
jgi:acetolactate synthase I/II/III large subunit